MNTSTHIGKCAHCGRVIVIFDDGKGTPRKYCCRVCRNAFRKAKREMKQKERQ